MNAVEIEQAISDLAAAPFDAAAFPYAFLAAFGNKETTLARLRAGGTNKSDVDGGLLQGNNIHLQICATGQTSAALAALQTSSATARHKAKFVLATDGHTLEAADCASGDTIVCDYADFPDHFGFFLPLAGISTVRQISDNAFDIRATSRLNRLYLELIKDNPDWAGADKRHDLNHFLARLIFCFFAEDTDIFNGKGLFTATVAQMSEGENAHTIMGEIFRAMNTKLADRATAQLPRWADAFPYVNGGLFAGAENAGSVPRFSRISRSYLLHVGSLDWTQINPDIFGSMIQAVADDAERGQLGMHYTSVPNILKVLNPLFLDDLRQKLADAQGNKAKLLNLRKRLARIRVFDPACGSGNFLVIAYKALREMEHHINTQRGEDGRKSDIPLTNFRGIELRDFSAEIARLALIIAEYQCDVRYRGQKDALLEFLPLSNQNWITSGNALRLDWLAACPPAGTGVKLTADDLFDTPLDQAQIDFDNAGGETYLCGNPPYLGSTWQDAAQKDDLKQLFDHRVRNWKSLDYVAGWFIKAADYCRHSSAAAPVTAAFVSTNSICQGQQVPILWPAIFAAGCHISFAHTSFKWANLAAHNAGVTVAIIGISAQPANPRRLFALNEAGQTTEQQCAYINAYLVAGDSVIVEPRSKPLDERGLMEWGNKPTDGGHFFMDAMEKQALLAQRPEAERFIKRFLGAQEFIKGQQRYCLWIEDAERAEAEAIPEIKRRIDAVKQVRADSRAAETRVATEFPHRFRQIQSIAKAHTLVVARVSSEGRDYLPVGLEDANAIIGDRNFALYDAPLWNLALIASRLHWVWIGAVCVRLEMRFSYSNTLGWNTFPLPKLTAQQKIDLTRSAEAILQAREAHFPATIADLYAADAMPAHLRATHDANDELIERIFIGRRFKNDTERLEKLFALYAQRVGK